jgi:hypothetical protein
MLDLGLTTFAETARTNAFRYVMPGVPVPIDLLATVAGIEPASPVWNRRIAPHLGSLKWIEGKMPHPLGTIGFRLQRNRANGISGEIRLPKRLNGTFEWKGKTILLKPGAQKVRL